MRDKNGRQEPGGRDDTCDHVLSRSWKVEVREEKKKKKKECTSGRVQQYHGCRGRVGVSITSNENVDGELGIAIHVGELSGT